MTRRTSTRTALVTLGLLALAACVVNLGFDIKKDVPLQTQSGANNFSQNVLVDLSQYKEVTDHKDNIDSFSFESADATVKTVNPGNKAQHVTGTLVLRQTLTDTAHDVPVGSIALSSIAQGTTVTIKGNAALDAFLLQQIKGAGTASGGTFYAVITNGSVDNVADLVLSLDLHVSIGYNAGL